MADKDNDCCVLVQSQTIFTLPFFFLSVFMDSEISGSHFFTHVLKVSRNQNIDLNHVLREH